MDYLKQRWSSLSSLSFYGDETKNEAVNQDVEANREPLPNITYRVSDVKQDQILNRSSILQTLPKNNIAYSIPEMNEVPLRKKFGNENPAFMGTQTGTSLQPIGPRNRNSQ